MTMVVKEAEVVAEAADKEVVKEEVAVQVVWEAELAEEALPLLLL